MKWLPRSRGPDVRGDRAAGADLSSSGSRSTASASPAASRRSGPTSPVLVSSRSCAGARSPLAGQADLSMTTNGATFRLLAHELREAGLDRVNISLDTLDRDRFHADDPARRARQRARRHRGRQGGRVRPGQDQRRRSSAASTTTRSSTSPASAASTASRCGSSSSCRSTPTGTGCSEPGRQPGRDRRRDRRGVPARAGAGPRRRAGRPLALPRRRGHGRRDPDGHQAVLRRLRPGAAHRRRPVPHLPVRHRRVRPAGGAAQPARPTTSSPPRSSARSAPSGPGTRSTRSTSSARAQSMSQIGG